MIPELTGPICFGWWIWEMTLSCDRKVPSSTCNFAGSMSTGVGGLIDCVPFPLPPTDALLWSSTTLANSAGKTNLNLWLLPKALSCFHGFFCFLAAMSCSLPMTRMASFARLAADSLGTPCLTSSAARSCVRGPWGPKPTLPSG